MSQKVRDALRLSMQPDVADFVDASVAVLSNELARTDLNARHRHDNLAAKVARLELLLENLSKRIETSHEDDKYALTRRKLIRLAQKMGIE